MGVTTAAIGDWKFLKYVEEPYFGPGAPIHTLFIVGTLDHKMENFQGLYLLLALPTEYVMLANYFPSGQRFTLYFKTIFGSGREWFVNFI